MTHHFRISLSVRLVLLACLSATSGLFAPTIANAQQGTTQVIVMGAPPVLPSPFLGDLVRDYRAGVYSGQFIYSSPSSVPTSFRLRVRLDLDGRRVVDIQSDPTVLTPGIYTYRTLTDDPSFRFNITDEDFLAAIRSHLPNTVERGGLLPEGSYVLTLELSPDDPSNLIVAIPSVNFFTVALASPPVLFTPPDQAIVNQDYPMFAWTSVIEPSLTSVEYDLLVVEMRDDQTPLQAIESNRPHAEITVVQNTALYSTTQLPFEDGKQYAWEVRARDPNDVVPFADDGRTEINIFEYRQGSIRRERIADLGDIVIQPGFAKLAGLTNVRARPGPSSIFLEGPAMLQLETTPPTRVEVELNQFEIQNVSLENPVIMGGAFAARSAGRLVPPLPNVTLRDVRWSMVDGLTVGATLDLPDAQNAQTAGRLRLTAQGFSGELVATGSPLMTVGDVVVEARIERIAASFPTGVVTASGGVNVFGGASGCKFEDVRIDDTDYSIPIHCTSESEVELFGSTNPLVLDLGSLRGTIRRDQAAASGVFYDLSLVGVLKFGETSASSDCGVEIGLRMTSADGLVTERSRSNCWASEFTVGLGAFEAVLRQVRLESLTVDGQDVDAALLADITLRSSLLPSLDLPEIDDVAIDASGFHFPRLDLAATDFPTTLAVALLRLTMDSFTMPPLVHPYFDWQETGPGPWDYEFRARARWKDEDSVPACLRDAQMTAGGIHTPDSSLAVVLTADDVTDCRIPIGTAATLVIDDFRGAVGGFSSPDTTFADSRLFVNGRVEWNEPFGCSADANPDMTAAPSEFEFHPGSGGVSGNLTNIHPSCPLTAGPFDLEVTASELTLDGSRRQQTAVLSGAASLRLTESVRVDGTFALNIVTGEFEDLSFELVGPFRWSLPGRTASNEISPVLTFEVDRAALSKDGFVVDGTQRLIVDDQAIAVEFDSFVVDVETGSVTGGSATIGGAFTLEVGINETSNALAFASRQAGASARFDSGFLVRLSPGIRVDSTGLRAAGLFEGELNYGGESFESNFAVMLSSNFAVGFNPPRIMNGRADLEWKDTRVAYADADGFHPDVSFIAAALLPDRIPLPVESMAYLEIRDGETDLVTLIEEANGVIAISSRGTGPRLVVPAVNPDSPPVFAEVTLDNLRFRMANGSPEYVSGSIRADAGPDLATASDFPVEIRSIAFENRTTNAGPLTALFVDGTIRLFDADTDIDVTLAGYADGSLVAIVDVANAAASIPMVPNSTAIRLDVDALRGEVAYRPTGADVDVEVDARLVVADGPSGGIVAEAALGLRWDGSHLVLSSFRPTALPDRPSLSLGPLGLRIDSLVAVPEFRYESATGWTFGLDVDASMALYIEGDPDRPLIVPIRAVEITDTGITIPAQDISESTIRGLDLPALVFGGLELKPLALRTITPLIYDWEGGLQSTPSPQLDVAIFAPELSSYGVLPADGLTIRDAGFANGTLTGSIDPISWITPRRLPIVVGSDAAPYLYVAAVSGGLQRAANGSQAIDIRFDGQVEELPGFESADCPAIASVSLTLVGGKGLAGSVGNVIPCGSIPLGPLSVGFSNGDLAFSFTNDTQVATLSGTAIAEFPATTPNGAPPTASGSLVVDILNGSVTAGEIRISEPFTVSLPFQSTQIAAFPDVCKLTMQDGLLNADGLTLNGAGSFGTGDSDAGAAMQLNNLLVAWDTGTISAGSATIASTLDLHFALSPLGFSFVDPTDPPPSQDHVLVDFDNSATLDAEGLNFDGQATADIVFAGEQFASLTVGFENDFAMRIGSFGVTSGRVAMYLPAQPNEPLATIDASGFSIGGGIVALLPARIGLPSEEVAYVVTRDAQDITLLDVGDTPTGGHTLATRAPIDLVVPALDAGNGPTVFGIEFDLITDASFNVLSGSISLASPVDLEPSLGVPLVLQSLGIASNNGPVELALSVLIDLPDGLGDHDLTGDIRFSRSGPTGRLVLGDPNAGPTTPAVTTFAFGDSQTNFTIGVQSVELELDSTPTLAVRGNAGSSLLDPDAPSILWNLAHTSGTSSFDIRLPGDALELDLGSVSFALAGQDPLTAVLTDDSFVLGFDGVVNFENVLAEPLEIAIEDLEIGVVNVSSNPSIHFGMGGAASLGDLQLSLFDGAAELDVRNPGVSIDAGGLAITASNGDLTFLETEISFTNFRISTDGGFTVDQLDATDVQLVGEYVVLTSIGFTTVNGLRLTANVDVTLPEPVSATSEATIVVRRDSNGAVKVESTNAAFDLNTEIALGDFGKFKLTAALVDINVFDPRAAAVKATGRLRVGSRDVLFFGEAGDIKRNPGIEFSNLLGLRYNVTGAVNFSVEHSFFRIDVEADAVASSSNEFKVEFGGAASIMIDGVGGKVGYEGLTVTSSGVQEYGNVVAPAQVTLMEFATLEIGRFVQQSSPTGINIDVPMGFDAKPNELVSRAGGSQQTKKVNVTEYLCFGPCGSNSSSDALRISLGGQSSNSSGGFSGGVGEILFYKTTNAETYLLVRDVNMQLDEMLTMSASMEYAQGPDGFALRVVAGGSLEVGSISAEAALAGTIRNKNGDLSFGLFVAVSASAGIPIVPGVVELTGAGGGFFYRPTSGDLATVTGPSGALAILGFDLQHQPSARDINFAVMLYAEAGIAGTAGNYAVEGAAFLQITDQSIYLEAQGSVLGFDGSGNLGATATAGFYLEANRNPFLVEAGVTVDIQIPVYLDGNLDVELFIARINNNTVWGVLGNGELGFINNLITATGRFAACNDGFLVQAALVLDLDLPVIKIESTIEGAIWLNALPTARYPFGAYVTFDARVCAGVCLGIGAEAALVSKRPSGFELFVAVRAYTSLGGEIRAWASVSDDGVRGGLGRGKHGDLIQELKQQADDFIAYVEQQAEDMRRAKEEIERAEAEKLVPHGVSPEVVAQAGANFHLKSQSERSSVANDILFNEKRHASTLPNEELNFVSGFVLKPDPSRPELTWAPVDAAAQQADALITDANALIDEVEPRLARAVALAVTYEAESEELLDAYLDALVSSPLTAAPPESFVLGAGEPLEFSVDETVAASQSSNGELAAEAAAVADAQVLEAINTIDQYMKDIDDMISFKVSIEVSSGGDLEGGPGPITVTSQPGVSDAMRAYTRAVEGSDRYYALAADVGWRTRGWSQTRRGELMQRRSRIETGIQSLYESASTDANRRFQSRERVRFLHELAESTGLAADLQRHDAAFLQNPLTEYKKVGMQLWYDAHVAGLDTLANASARTSMTTLREAQAASAKIRTAQAAVAESSDEVYALRAEMAANLYNLVDSYLAVRSSAVANDTVTTRLEGVRQRLLNELAPPSLTGIAVAPNRIGYRNETDITWSAAHPAGMAEVSYAIERKNNPGPALPTGYASAGNAQSVRLYAVKDNYPAASSTSPEGSYETQQYTVGIRVRGRGGRTAQRTATFEVGVGPGTSATDGGGDILVPDDTPPPKPVIALDANYGYSMLLDPATGNMTRRYWTSNGQQLDLRLLAYDLESDIQSIEYAVGTERGVTDIIDWAPLEGSRTRDTQSAYLVRIDGPTKILDLELGTAYHISARAINGEGLVSAVQYSHPISLDDTPPSRPNAKCVYHPIILPTYISVPVTPLVDAVPNYSDPYFTNDQWLNIFQSTPRPSVMAGWQASTDPESGIRRYEVANSQARTAIDFGPEPAVTPQTEYIYRASGHEPYNYANMLENDFTARYTGAVTSYADTVWVHVRGQNNARAYSDITTMARVARDPTGPIRPTVAAGIDGANLRIYLTSPAYDFESGVAGLQYALGTNPGDSDLRAWRSGVDFSWSNTQSLAENFVPDNPDNCMVNCDQTRSSFTIPLKSVPQATQFYLSLRAVNKQGSVSAPTAAGPIFIDSTPPVVGGVSLTDNGNGTITIRASNVRDPESGLERVEFRLKDASDPFKGTLWASLFAVYSTKTSMSGEKTVSMSGYTKSSLRVGVRVTNGAGGLTTIWTQFPITL